MTCHRHHPDHRARCDGCRRSLSRRGLIALLVWALAALLLSSCAHGAVAANEARKEACQRLESQIERQCAPEGGQCTGVLTTEETKASLQCTRGVCDAIRERLEEIE